MGLKNASQQFQQLLDDCLKEVSDIATGNIDDILVATRRVDTEDLLDTHERDLRKVLQILKEKMFVANIDKCKLFVKTVEFCGHILGNGERRPAPGKLRVIEKWEPHEPLQNSEHT